MNSDLIYEIYKDKRTVFTLQEIAILVNEPDFSRIKQRINYFVKKGRLNNPRRGIYTKDRYSPGELACRIYRPSYISLEYVLNKSGIVFQYSDRISVVSYLSRSIVVDKNSIDYRKIRNDILINTSGIVIQDDGISIATPERAFLDLVYLNKGVYIDSGHLLNKDIIYDLLKIYDSVRMNNYIRYHF